MTPTTEQVEQALDRIRKHMKGFNFAGTVLDDIWAEQITTAAVEYIDANDFSIFIEADEEEMLGGSVVGQATDIVLNAFLEAQGYRS